jgi:hypothetical protein
MGLDSISVFYSSTNRISTSLFWSWITQPKVDVSATCRQIITSFFCIASRVYSLTFYKYHFLWSFRLKWERGWLFVLFLGGVKNNFVSHALVMIIKIVWGKCLQNLLYISFLSVYTSDRNKTKSELHIWHPKHHSSS